MVPSVGLWKVPECSICYSPLLSDLCSLNTCGHVFHNECARKWFDSKRTKCPCPLCRTPWTLRSQRTLNFIVEPVAYTDDKLNELPSLSTVHQVAIDAIHAELQSVRDAHSCAVQQLEASKIVETTILADLQIAKDAAEKYKTQRNDISAELDRLRKLYHQLQKKCDQTKDKIALMKYLEEPGNDDEFAELLSQFHTSSVLHNRLREQTHILKNKDTIKERWRQNSTDLKAANDRLVVQLMTEQETILQLTEEINALKKTIREQRRHRHHIPKSKDFNNNDESNLIPIINSSSVKKRLRNNVFLTSSEVQHGSSTFKQDDPLPDRVISPVMPSPSPLSLSIHLNPPIEYLHDTPLHLEKSNLSVSHSLPIGPLASIALSEHENMIDDIQPNDIINPVSNDVSLPVLNDQTNTSLYSPLRNTFLSEYKHHDVIDNRSHDSNEALSLYTPAFDISPLAEIITTITHDDEHTFKTHSEECLTHDIMATTENSFNEPLTPENDENFKTAECILQSKELHLTDSHIQLTQEPIRKPSQLTERILSRRQSSSAMNILLAGQIRRTLGITSNAKHSSSENDLLSSSSSSSSSSNKMCPTSSTLSNELNKTITTQIIQSSKTRKKKFGKHLVPGDIRHFFGTSL